MKNWKSLLEEKVSKKHRNAVFDKVAPLLKAQRQESLSRRGFAFGMLGSALAGIVAIITYNRFSSEKSLSPGEIGMLAIDEDILKESELLEDLVVLEEFEELETLIEDEELV